MTPLSSPRNHAILLLACFAVMVAACYPKPKAPTPDLIDAGYYIVDQLLAQTKIPLRPDDVILVTTFADVSNLQASSTMGRMLAEFTASGFTRKGFLVKEIRLSPYNVYTVKREGEFVLSREIGKLGRQYKADFIVAGVYGHTGNRTYVNAKLIAPATGDIYSTVDVVLPIDS
ncbi:FlgO family outer membrane protein [Desulfovibrio inopinatus]|uniref:FlgO family outer membrane protein n=1 Tax=Desulfovibrio inopinatus TaxID=102109 RepID=UPI00040FDAD4|nr:FlgO family outer membrane protein [Desulfovibrio inopinatus]